MSLRLLLLLPFFLPLLLAAQPDTEGLRFDWVDVDSSGFFLEGLYAIDVGEVPELISFHAYIEKYNFGSGSKLVIMFNAPEETPYLLQAQESIISEKYGMESRPGTIKQGKQELGSWDIDKWLDYYQVYPSNLAILLRIRSFVPDGTYVLPVNVFSKTGSNKPIATEYKALFRQKSGIESGTCKIFKGLHYRERIPPDALLDTKDIPLKLPESPLEISIDTNQLGNEENWFTVSILVTDFSGSQTPLRFFFFHAPP